MNPVNDSLMRSFSLLQIILIMIRLLINFLESTEFASKEKIIFPGLIDFNFAGRGSWNPDLVE